MRWITGSTTYEGRELDWGVPDLAGMTRLPVVLLSREDKATELERVQRQRAMLAAYEAELIMGLADDTPALPADHPAAGSSSWAPDGALPGVDESFAHELSMILNLWRRSASIKAARAFTYRENLPATRAALAAGELDEPRALALVDSLESAAPEVAREVDAELLPEAAELSVGKLRKRALALLLERKRGGRRRTAEEGRAAGRGVGPALAPRRDGDAGGGAARAGGG